MVVARSKAGMTTALWATAVSAEIVPAIKPTGTATERGSWWLVEVVVVVAVVVVEEENGVERLEV
jgi:hypothetical protein